MENEWKPEIGEPAWYFDVEVLASGINRAVLVEGTVKYFQAPDLVCMEDLETGEQSMQFMATVYGSMEDAVKDLVVRPIGQNGMKLGNIIEI